MNFGYYRVNIKYTGEEPYKADILKFCASSSIELLDVFHDVGSNDNSEYSIIVRLIGKNDKLVLRSADDLGRSAAEVLKELKKLQQIGAKVYCLDMPITLKPEVNVTVSEVISQAVIGTYEKLADRERERMRAKQKQGIEEMKARGDFQNYGRKRIVARSKFNEQYEKVLNGEIKPFECIKQLGVSIPTYYRYRREYEETARGTVCKR